MCEVECRKRFERVELKVNQMANDMLWVRWMLRTGLIAGGAILGLDVAGMV